MIKYCSERLPRPRRDRRSFSLVSLALISLSCAAHQPNVDIAFQQAQHEDTVSGYFTFLDQYPSAGATYQARAKQRMDELTAQAAAREQIAAKEGDREWEKTKEETAAKAAWTPPVERSTGERNHLPVGKAFEEAKRDNSISGYHTFLEEYPEAPPAVRHQAEQRLRELEVKEAQRAFELARQDDSMAAYWTFLQEHPDAPSEQREWVQQRMSQLDAVLRAQEAATVRVAQVVVTSGGINGTYRVLGPVHVDTVGVVNVGNVLSAALFPRSKLEAAIEGERPKARPDQINQLLKQEAFRLYGPDVHAIINVTQQVRRDGDVFADGLAVQFTRPEIVKPPLPPAPASHAPPGNIEERLRELKSLLDRKLINQKDYEKRKAELLRQL